MRREIDAGDLIEVARQLKSRAPGGAAEIQRLPRRSVAHRFNRQARQRLREVRHVEILVPVVELGVLGDQPIRLVVGGLLRGRRFRDDIAESGMLEEVATEGVARFDQRFVAARNPRPALDQIVPIVEGRHREIVVDRMRLESLKRIRWRLGPLPDVADHIEERPLRKLGHRTRGRVSGQPEVRGYGLRVGEAVDAGKLAHRLPLILGRQTHRLAAAARFPLTERLGLVVIRFHRPVPQHRHFFEHQAQAPLRAVPDPEGGMFGLRELLPRSALFQPQRLVGITTGFDECEELAIGHQIPARLKRRNRRLVETEFVVPAINLRVAALTAQAQDH